MKCPGQDMRYWKFDSIYEIKCPYCGNPVEFFKDEPTRKCKNCGKRVANPKMDFGCAAYCQYAEQCLGELPAELLKNRDDLLKNRVAIEMKKYFEKDFKRISHATKVARYAEQIGREEGAHLGVLLSAAYLHDIGIKNAEKKYNSNSPKYQELEGPPVAREILEKLDAKQELIDEVCDIVGHHHHPREEETINFKCLYDADMIVNLSDDLNENKITVDIVKKRIENNFFTKTGKELAKKILLKNKGGK